ncbi:TonB-dependent receptor plug domain-containing protein [Chitinophaga lutea]
MLLLSLLTSGLSLQAQLSQYERLKEKVYLHTSHLVYKPGTVMHFKIYVVRAADNTPSAISRNVHVELINPAGNVAQHLRFELEQGVAEGSLDLPASMPGGQYRLRAYTGWMQNEKDSLYFTKELLVQQVITPRILMKLDFPKKGYGAGDEVTATFSARTLDDLPLRNRIIRFRAGIGGAPLDSGNIETNKDGEATIRFHLPAQLHKNDGLLNITVSHDGHIESIARSIPIVLNNIDLQFMPEGGTLVAGLPANVAFRALNEFGRPADVRGEIVDEGGRFVAGFAAYRHGMGSVLFTPRAGRRYFARITAPQGIARRYALPQATSRGISMQANVDSDNVHIVLHSTVKTTLRLDGTLKGQPFFSRPLEVQPGIQMLDIPASVFPAGIARLTLHQSNGVPVAERVLFLHRQQMLQVRISMDKTRYLPREKVTLRLRTTDKDGKPLASNLSLSVVDDKLWTFADDKQDNIVSWLMMSSELRGRIEEPASYFSVKDTGAAKALDLVMLTHGYRYFDYIPAVTDPARPRFLPGVENQLNGVVMDEKDKPVQAKVWLVDERNGGRALEVNTDPEGRFYFTDFESGHQYTLIASTGRKNQRVRVQLEINGAPPKKGDTLRLMIRGVAPVRQDTVAAGSMSVEPPSPFDGEDKLLSEVIVVGMGHRQREIVTGSITTVTRETLPVTQASLAHALNGRVSGVSVTTAANPAQAPDVAIRGSRSISNGNKPLVIIDGVVVDGFPPDLSPSSVRDITILKDDAAAAIYGSPSVNGVIIITTHSMSLRPVKLPQNGPFFYTLPIRLDRRQFAVARRFYAPAYESTDTEKRTDFRDIIYWNPIIQTNKNGEAEISFWNSDASTTFRAIAEGLSWNGRPGRAEHTYSARSAIGVDAKVPLQLTVGDIAAIPLNIRNNTLSPLTAKVNGSFSKGAAGTIAKDLTIGADTAAVVEFPFSATAPTSGMIDFTVTTTAGKEALQLPIRVVQKGFPVMMTLAGDRAEARTFNIVQSVPGTLQYELKVFSSLEGQLLDGISSMLREPHGCFEQVSSTTYPNILILQYLRETGKSNPDAEREALGMIGRGYKKLLAFETADGGFEWFGKTPPHEALTAYGLLEFTDMKPFIDVDPHVLERTKKFLLSRRDGKGGFKLSSGGYDRFATVPNRVADAYIVYAMARAGYGNDVLPEYREAAGRALQGNDAYLMALNALSARYMQDTATFRTLLDRLRKNYHDGRFKAETSVVNSRPASLETETLALFCMALARDVSPDIPLMASLVSRLLRSKSYFGYSSTQATVLALNAVLDYRRLAGSGGAAMPKLMINGETVQPGTHTLSLKDGTHNVDVAYGEGGHRIPYSLEVSYATLTPPSAADAPLTLQISLGQKQVRLGEAARLDMTITNREQALQAMSIAKIGIPAGLSLQPWQLKELTEQNQVAYYELFDNYLVLYWMGFAPGETKRLHLELKAEIPGRYRAKASNAYLYYGPEHKHWLEGIEVEVLR